MAILGKVWAYFIAPPRIGGERVEKQTKVSKAQQRAVNKYVKENYDRINVTFPKGQKEIIKAHAEAHSETVNGFIGRAVLETMERDKTAPGAAE